MNDKQKPKSIPPKALWVLKRILPKQDLEQINGNFEDLYENIAATKGYVFARIWIWGEIIKSLPGFFNAKIYWRRMMLKNNFTISVRTIRKHKIYSFINIAGLSLGMAVCLLIFLWIQEELGYDRFHSHKHQIAQVYSVSQYSSGSTQTFMGSYYPLAQVIKDECSEVKEVARFNTTRGVLLQHGEQQFMDDVIGLADPAFFKIFTFPLLQGDPGTILSDNYSAVLTEKMAKKYFGNDDPLGKVLNVSNAFDIRVTGVIQDVPTRSSLQFDCIVPFKMSFAPEFKEPEHWGGNPFATYVRLHENVSFSDVGQKITGIVERHNPSESGYTNTFHLHPLTKLHLYSPGGGGLIQTLIIFSIIALFVLIIACINFMNLSTAKATTRAKEVGVRKVIGAQKGDLIRQFMGESLMITFITLAIAVLVLILFLPTLNSLLGKQLSLTLLHKPVVILGFLGIALFTGILSGSYPSLYLSAFQPAHILRNKIKTGGSKSSGFRKGLVLVQFTLSIFLIISTIGVYRQLGFVMTKDLGFDRENLLILTYSQGLRNQYESFKTELLNSPHILGVTKSMQGPWNIASTVRALEWDGKDPDETVHMNWDYVDYDYFQTLQIEIIQGRSFSREFPTDEKEAYVVNEEAVKLMGMDSPVGQRLSVFRNQGRIIGVAKNFHFQPLQYVIKPFVFILRPDVSSNIFVRLKPENISGTLEYIGSTFKKFDPDFPQDPLFFNDILKTYIYNDERRIGRISSYFTGLAILISCLGLFGLVTFMAERRTKEIGIRKVMGASAGNVVVMLSRDFIKWVIIANVIAWPAAYLTLQKILSQYAYKTSLGLEIFILSGLAALIIATMTAGYQSLRAAKSDPVDALRYE